MSHEIVTKQKMWRDATGWKTKESELTNTFDMPQSPSPSMRNDTKTPLAPINKIASAEDMLKVAFGVDVNVDAAEQLHKEQPKSLPQAAALKPHVDVTGKEPTKTVHEKKASLYALPSLEKYPLDGYDQVVKAASYFDEWGIRMTPEMRHEYCTNLVKRAHVLGIAVSEDAEHYGSEVYGPTAQVKIAVDARRSVLQDAVELATLDKIASLAPVIGPEDFAVLLSEFDKSAGLDEHWGGDVPDPYYSTFGKVAENADESIIVGNEYITERKLTEFSKRDNHGVCERFGKEFATEFTKDPMGIFYSLPRDQKLVLMRMANSSDSTIFGATT